MNSKVTMVLRIVLALILIVFGVNKFANFMPMPPPEGDAAVYMKGLAVTGVMFPLLGVLEILIGILLITKKAIPFALVLLAPIAFNMVLFHATLAMDGIAASAIVLVLNIILIYAYWDRLKGLLD